MRTVGNLVATNTIHVFDESIPIGIRGPRPPMTIFIVFTCRPCYRRSMVACVRLLFCCARSAAEARRPGVGVLPSRFIRSINNVRAVGDFGIMGGC